MSPVVPFATVTELEEAWRPLTARERVYAQMLLEAAARWIRRKKPAMPASDPDARLVSIQVTQDALAQSRFPGLTSFAESVGDVSRSGTKARADSALIFTPHHRELLGLPAGDMPRWQFGGNDVHW